MLLCNGMLAMTEIAFVSVRKARLQQWAEAGDKDAQLALDIANAPNEMLSVIQIGITLVGIMAGAFAGSTISDDFSAFLQGFPVFVTYADPIALSSVVAITTYFSLIVGELVPKRLALSSPELIAKRMARPMMFLSSLGKPIVKLLTVSSAATLALLRVREGIDEGITEHEIKVLVSQATEAGVFDRSEQELFSSIFRFGDRKAASLMTPRTHIEWIDINDPKETIIDQLCPVSNRPVVIADGQIDEYIGVADAKDILAAALKDPLFDLRKIATDPMSVPENTTALQLLLHLRSTGAQLAVVRDEYGGLQGFVTKEDLFEAIVGELPLHGEVPRWEIVTREDGSWLMDGQVPIDTLKDLLELKSMPGAQSDEYQTVAGFILYQFKRIPAAGDTFVWQGLQFEIVDMDKHRIDKVLISKLTPETKD